MKPEGELTLRPVQRTDAEFLLEVYASTRAEELERVPWSAEQKQAFVRMQYEAQNQHYAAEYPQASHEIICAGQTPVDRLYMDRSAEKFHILDVTILPGFRGSGIGTKLVRQILNEASQSNKPVTIYVESFNPSLQLFRKLGFERASEDGFHWLLRWQPIRT